MSFAFTRVIRKRQDLTPTPSEDTVDGLYEEGAANYIGIIAYYRDAKTGNQQSITAGDQAKPRRLTHLYASKASAQRAVDREWQRMLPEA